MALDTVGAPTRLVLASASPRRHQILSAVGLLFDTLAVEVDEEPRPGERPEQLARRLAIEKARAGAARAPDHIVLGADTVVALGRHALGKPTSPEDAVAMLRRLRGRQHRVLTAVAAARRHGPMTRPRSWSKVCMTQVWMRPYTDTEIETYVASGDPFDKAGAYAIQGPIFRPVARIEGCFLTVVGLPLPAVYELLARAGSPRGPLSEAGLDAICPGCTDKAELLAD